MGVDEVYSFPPLLSDSLKSFLEDSEIFSKETIRREDVGPVERLLASFLVVRAEGWLYFPCEPRSQRG